MADPNLNPEEKKLLKGFRTLIVGLALAIAPTALQYLTGFDWAQYVGPTGAMAISGLIMIAMRLVTSSKVGTKA